jgi:hypothetical protein
VKPFIVNRHGSLVLPSNFFPEIDFSRLNTLEQFAAVVKRDFEQKAPVGPDLIQRVESRTYRSRYELLRDLGLHLFWIDARTAGGTPGARLCGAACRPAMRADEGSSGEDVQAAFGG